MVLRQRFASTRRASKEYRAGRDTVHGVARSGGQLAVVLSLSLTILTLLLSGCEDSEKSNDPVIVFFHTEGCSDCRHMKESLAPLLSEYPMLAVAYYDTDENENRELLRKLAARYDVTFGSRVTLPVIFVAETAIIGEGRTQELELQAAVKTCASGDCPSPFDRLR